MILTTSSNPWLASHVQDLTHSCHLPPPAIFEELPATDFCGRSLSHDSRTLKLLELACANLINIHSLKIIFGHANIVRGLLIGLFGPSRHSQKPVQKLWLEDCSLSANRSRASFGVLNFDGLQSIRIRRLKIHDKCEYGTGPQTVYSRGLSRKRLQDSAGSLYKASTSTTDIEAFAVRELFDTFRFDLDSQPPAEYPIPDYHVTPTAGVPKTNKSNHDTFFLNQMFEYADAADRQIWRKVARQRPDLPAVFLEQSVSSSSWRYTLDGLVEDVASQHNSRYDSTVLSQPGITDFL